MRNITCRRTKFKKIIVLIEYYRGHTNHRDTDSIQLSYMSALTLDPHSVAESILLVQGSYSVSADFSFLDKTVLS